MYNVLADTIILIHFLFILFAVGGGLLVIRWPKAAFIHLPAAIWGAAVELCGFICPFTPLENHLRLLAGNASYSGDFLAQYLLSIIYPEGMTPFTQKVLGFLVILINAVFYILAFKKRRLHNHS